MLNGLLQKNMKQEIRTLPYDYPKPSRKWTGCNAADDWLIVNEDGRLNALLQTTMKNEGRI